MHVKVNRTDFFARRYVQFFSRQQYCMVRTIFWVSQIRFWQYDRIDFYFIFIVIFSLSIIVAINFGRIIPCALIFNCNAMSTRLNVFYSIVCLLNMTGSKACFNFSIDLKQTDKLSRIKTLVWIFKVLYFCSLIFYLFTSFLIYVERLLIASAAINSRFSILAIFINSASIFIHSENHWLQVIAYFCVLFKNGVIFIILRLFYFLLLFLGVHFVILLRFSLYSCYASSLHLKVFLCLCISPFRQFRCQ